jgi:hypothetical protein
MGHEGPRSPGNPSQARFRLDPVLTAGRLALYSEQIGGSGDLLGNFSAFTHLV